MKTYLHYLISLTATLLIILTTDCNKEGSSKADDKAWWSSNKYDLAWYLPAGGSSLRFFGTVKECPSISNFKYVVGIGGTIPTDEGSIWIYAKDSSEVKFPVPDYPPGILNRQKDVILSGHMVMPEGEEISMTINLHIDVDIDVEKNTGTLNYPATGITGAQATYGGVTVPWPVPFSSLLTKNESITGNKSPCR